ncbi:MAG: alpha/beta hydrolase [Actinobacteria bacterium]|nr:alpha/beta hydrolase [Actinomycetota bacterium]
MTLNSSVHSRHLDKDAIVLIHGMGSASTAWKLIIPSLLESFTVITAAMSPTSILSITALAPAGLWLVPFEVRYPGTALARMMASSLKLVSPLLLRYEWARKIGFSDVSPRWREYSYEVCLDATNAMAKAAGYYPAWDGLLKKRFEKEVDSSIPISIVFGDSDKTLPKETCQERSLAPSQATWTVYESCGHAPMWDYPNRVVDQVFLTTNVSR